MSLSSSGSLESWNTLQSVLWIPKSACARSIVPQSQIWLGSASIISLVTGGLSAGPLCVHSPGDHRVVDVVRATAYHDEALRRSEHSGSVGQPSTPDSGS